jgi:hypothetical protein
MLATLCVTSSLTLFALGGSYPIGGFCLGTSSFVGPLAIVGPIWDTISRSHAIAAGVMCEEWGRHVNLVYYAPYYVL